MLKCFSCVGKNGALSPFFEKMRIQTLTQETALQLREHASSLLNMRNIYVFIKYEISPREQRRHGRCGGRQKDKFVYRGGGG